MNDALLLMLSILGILAVYWALIGQWKWNKMVREEENAKETNKKQGKTGNI